MKNEYKHFNPKEYDINVKIAKVRSSSHVSQETVKRYIQEQQGKDVFEYDIFECPQHLKGQLKIGDFLDN